VRRRSWPGWRRPAGCRRGVDVGAGEGGTVDESEVAADLDCHCGVVAGDDFDGDAQARQALQRVGRVELGWVEEHEEAG